MSNNQILKRAIELNEAGSFQESIGVLQKLLDNCISIGNLKNVHVILGHIGTNFLDLGDGDNALSSFEESLHYNSRFEFSSLGRYLSLCKLDREEEAIQEMVRYLESNEADLYKSTLEELLEGLEDGYSTKWELTIRDLATKNGVNIHPGPSLGS